MNLTHKRISSLLVVLLSGIVIVLVALFNQSVGDFELDEVVVDGNRVFLTGTTPSADWFVFVQDQEQSVAQVQSTTSGAFSIRLSELAPGFYSHTLYACPADEVSSNCVTDIVNFQIVEQVQAASEDQQSDDNNQLYVVTDITDGDTIKVKINDRFERIRLIGIDAPETQNPSTGKECFGDQSTDYLTTMLTGQRVRLESDFSQDDVDRYDRLLRYIFLADGTNVNLQMVEQGYAQEYTYRKPYEYQAEFQSAQKTAQESGRGMWGECFSDQSASFTPTKIVQTVTPQVKSAQTRPTVTTTPVVTFSPTSTPTQSSQVTENSTMSATCNCGKYCSKMDSCEEAYFQLNECGCTKRDADGDGVPCESICPGG